MKEQIVCCPLCNTDYTHLEGYAPYYKKDGSLCLHLIFSCETGHTFNMYLHQHRGYTCVTEDKYAADEGDFRTPKELVKTLKGGE